MKKIAWFLIVFLLVGMSAGFADMQPYEPMEVDPRVELIEQGQGSFEDGYRYEDVKFLRTGGIAFQLVKPDGPALKLHLYAGEVGGPYAHQAYPHLSLIPFDSSFLVEDAQGMIYFTDKQDVYAIDSELKNPAVCVLEDYYGNYQVESKGESILYYPNNSFGVEQRKAFRKEIAIMKPKVGHDFSAGAEFYRASEWDLIRELELEDGRILAIDFAETEEAIYALVDLQGDNVRLMEGPESGEGSDLPSKGRFEIVRFEMTFQENEEDRERQLMNRISFEMKERIPLFLKSIATEYMGLQFDGSEFIVSQMGGNDGFYTSLMRVDQTGDVFDSVRIPGVISHFDVNGSKVLASVISPYPQDQGLYLIDWKGKSTGSPRVLIAERTMHNRTLAVFRDKGYGLLRKEEPETGIVDYLAPLKTEEADVRLRIPLCDVTARVHENARYLEILYGEQRVDIPMSALDARSLLDQLPCETDATVELHLHRYENGNIKVTGELFVVEQVDAQTKVVHRLPIELP